MSFLFFKKRDRRQERQARDEKARSRRSRPSPVGFLLALLLWISALVLIYSGTTGPQSTLTVGQRAPVTVVASVDFSCTDVAKTELNRLQAANVVPPVFSVSFNMNNAATRTLDKLFDRITQLRQAAGESRIDMNRELANALDLLGISLSAAEARQLAPEEHEEQVRDTIKAILRKTWSEGIISTEEKKSAFRGIASSETIILRTIDGAMSEPIALADLPTPEEALAATVKDVAAKLGSITVPQAALSALLQPWISPNLLYDPHLTSVRKKEARDRMAPVSMNVRAGTTLVEAGERITPQILEQLNAHRQRQGQLESAYDRIIKKIGNAGLLMAALIACIGLVQILTPEVVRKESRILLLIVLSLLVIVPARGLLYLSGTLHLLPPAVVEFAVPLSLGALLASILLGPAVAIPIGLWISFATAVLFDNNFAILTLGLVVTIVAALSTRNVRSRSRIYRAGLFVGLAKMLYAISFGAITQQPIQAVVIQSLAGLATGIIAAFLTALLIPLFEWLFRITTNLTLLELSDMSNPLLQRLAMEAPGTYHHSIVVANLGEAAAARIGANSLLVRVGAYYHDIGKLAKPEFFTENMNLRDNPHDELSPNMSTIVITSHVKEGVSLARRHKLPRCVLNAIEQHHGTGVVSYFYHRAKQQAEEANGGKANGRAVEEGTFRYEGPKPRAKEMGILSLADAVEAASRSIEKPTPGRIEALVGEIVEKRLHDGQLDDCNLTLAELSEVKRSFVFSLANMLHVRVAYPQDENKRTQQSDSATATHADRGPADTVADAAGRRDAAGTVLDPGGPGSDG